MNAVTLKALRGSIAKWQRIVKDTRAEDKGQDNCPLCALFFDENCTGCPVSEATGWSFCDLSPYREWDNHIRKDHKIFSGNHRAPGCKECLRLAKAELAFLKSLLPKGAKR